MAHDLGSVSSLVVEYKVSGRDTHFLKLGTGYRTDVRAMSSPEKKRWPRFADHDSRD